MFSVSETFFFHLPTDSSMNIVSTMIEILFLPFSELYHCYRCDKVFFKLSTLKRHQYQDCGKPKHQCYLCDYSSTRLGNVRRHLTIHTVPVVNLVN